jgi:hypothetical protein
MLVGTHGQEAVEEETQLDWEAREAPTDLTLVTTYTRSLTGRRRLCLKK